MRVSSGKEGKNMPLFEVLSRLNDPSGMLPESSGEVSGWQAEFGSGYPNLAENASFAEKLVYGLKVCLIGMLIVFAVLAILCAVLYCFKIYYKLSQKKKQSAAEIAQPAVSAPGAADDEELTVAIATAAIAAMRNESDAAFRIISIQKID